MYQSPVWGWGGEQMLFIPEMTFPFGSCINTPLESKKVPCCGGLVSIALMRVFCTFPERV